MYHEICMAILPPHSLAKTLRDWNEIARQLAEPGRKRSRYAYRYVNAYWAKPLTQHNPELNIMQSIFSSAARREKLRERENAERRGGELKMDWTKPPEDSRTYGH
jgi:hypothetical protein